MNQSRRVHDRLDVAFGVTIKQGDRQIQARCVNISQGGMFIDTDPIPIGQTVTLTFDLPDVKEEIETDALVRWGERDERRGVGVQFVGLRAIEVWAINQLFRRASRDEH